MASNVLKYLDYVGTVEYSADDDCLFGKVIGINDLVSYEGNSIQELKADFISAIDDYIAFCKEQGKEPEKTYKGTFNVRIAPDLHRQAAIYAATHGKTLNSFVEEAIQHYVHGA